jgi:L-lactate dehydrogenase complex protein LldF
MQNLAVLLEIFEKNMTNNGANVLWAKDAREAQQQFLSIATKYKAQKVVKSKSMTTEEICFNEFCEKHSIEVFETDLGELIVQLAGEKPYHIVTPAMHKSTAEISRLFHDKLRIPLTESAEELTMAARAYLRKAYVSADIGVSGANFLIAEEGAVVITENEGNARLTTACPRVHVVFVGIEKILPQISHLGLFLPMLATIGTGQQITCYNSIIRGPKHSDEFDGPEKMYVILIDNGRSEIYSDNRFRQALCCIRCGACLNTCPIYCTVGGHTYNTPYQGPIGAVITPHLRSAAQWNHLAFASSLCGSCSEVCPVKIDIHRLLLENRWDAYKSKQIGIAWRVGLMVWAFIASRRSRMNLARKILRIGRRIMTKFLRRSKRKRIPDIPAKNFGQMWSENGQ